MDQSAVSHLIGRTATLQVSDPWEFGTQYGDAPLITTVTAVLDDCLLLHLQQPKAFQGLTFGYLAAHARHLGTSLSDLTQREIAVNCAPLQAYDGVPEHAIEALST